MAATGAVRGRSRGLILAAMIFAVAMTFIDQTIVSIAVPEIQKELGLSTTGVQWAVNAYLLSLAALFAFGGRLADTVGHRKMVTLGVIVFAGASALCGLTPKGSFAEAWIVTFRVIQGAGGAIMFPAALAIVVQTFALRERGRALALFFGIAGGLTAIGPVLGGFLTQWTWRAIFWVNIPVALIALALIVISRPVTEHRPARMDYRGLALIATGIALSVFGFQQSTIWGWHNPAIALCIAAGLALLVVFYFVELRTPSPLMEVRIFRIRPFGVQNIVLGISNLAFIPVFFFASEYAQISLAKSSSEAGIILLFFFIGFAIASQLGGRMLDKGGAKRPVVLGCALAAVGFWLWGGHVTSLSFSAQQWYIIVAGAGRRVHARPVQHRRGEQGQQVLLWRGDRHHPDRQELRRQPGHRGPRHGPRDRAAHSPHDVADRARRAERQGARAGGQALAGHRGKGGRERERRIDPALLPPRLRARDADGAVHHGGSHGRRRGRRDDRPALRCAAGTGARRRRDTRRRDIRRRDIRRRRDPELMAGSGATGAGSASMAAGSRW